MKEEEKKESSNAAGRPFWIGLLLILILAAVLRVAVTLTGHSYGTDDEATFGLMTRHLLLGREIPLIGWTAHYGGALQCYLAAPLFLIMGSGFTALKLSVLPLSLGLIVAAALYTRRIAGEAAALGTALLLAVPAPYLLAYAVNGFGIYAQVPFFAVLLLLLTDHLCFDDPLSKKTEGRLAFFWGLTAGLGVWSLPLFVVVIMAEVWQTARWARGRLLQTRNLALGIAGGLIGLSPMIYYNLVSAPGASVLRLGARVAGTNRAEIENMGTAGLMEALRERLTLLPWLTNLQFKNIGPLLGLNHLPVFGAILILSLFALLIIAGLVHIRRAGLLPRFSAVIALIPITLLFSLFAALDRPRTLITIYLSLMILAGAGFGAVWQGVFFTKKTGRALGVLLIAVPLITNLHLARPYLTDPGYHETNRAVIDFLKDQKIHHAYAKINLAMPLMFISGEEILVSTALSSPPLKRHPTANEDVEQAERKAVILHTAEQYEMENMISRLKEAGYHYETKEIPPFLILYNFEPPLKAAAILDEKK